MQHRVSANRFKININMQDGNNNWPRNNSLLTDFSSFKERETPGITNKLKSVMLFSAFHTNKYKKLTQKAQKLITFPDGDSTFFYGVFVAVYKTQPRNKFTYTKVLCIRRNFQFCYHHQQRRF